MYPLKTPSPCGVINYSFKQLRDDLRRAPEAMLASQRDGGSHPVGGQRFEVMIPLEPRPDLRQIVV
ncbi:MAG: hypothetical protein ABI618_08620 [Nitrospirota bacterium]